MVEKPLPESAHQVGEDPTRLFEEYLEDREAGRVPDSRGLVVRAGPRGDELQKRLEVLQAIEALSDLSAADDEGLLPYPEVPELRELGRYRDLVMIGRGGLSRVFAAEDPVLGRKVALKVLDSTRITIPDARAWMENEGRSLARLVHPNVLGVFELGEADGQLFVATEFVEGESLAAVIERMRERARGIASTESKIRCRSRVRLEELATSLEPLGARAALVLAIARALEYCHGQKVIHRDVKPGNVLVQPGPVPKLIDFGLAHFESVASSRNQVTQGLVGTPAYVAPEQVDHGRTGTSEASDQFSLGVLLYELLTLVSPFERGSWHETAAAISRAAPTAPRKIERSIAPDLELVCLHALERSPAERYPSLAAFASDLEDFLGHRAISVLPPGPWKRARLFARRNARDLRLAGAVVALALAVYLALAFGRHVATQRDFTRRIELHTQALPAAEGRDQFASLYGELRRLREVARELEASWMSRLGGTRAGAAERELMHACSKRLHEVVTPAFEASKAMHGNDRLANDNAVMQAWGQVLGMDRTDCPECPYNDLDRDRGRIEIGAPPSAPGCEIELWRQTGLEFPGAFSLSPAERVLDLVPGIYRVRVRDTAGGVLSEIEFRLEAGDPKCTLVPVIPPAPLRAALKPVRGRELVLDDRSRATVGPFLASELVRWKDLAAVLPPDVLQRERKLAERLQHVRVEDDAPAVLHDAEAKRYATGCGLRLPSATEWIVLALEDDSFRRSEGARLLGERVSGITKDGECQYVRYADAPAQGSFAPLVRSHKPDGVLTSTEGERSGLGFRLVISAP